MGLDSCKPRFLYFETIHRLAFKACLDYLFKRDIHFGAEYEADHSLISFACNDEQFEYIVKELLPPYGYYKVAEEVEE